MGDIEVRVLAEDDWETFKQVRLRALTESPEAFVATVAEEGEFDEAEWRSRMRRSLRLVAEDEEAVIGTVSLLLEHGQDGESELDDLDAAEVFGLWVEPSHRGLGAPSQLIDAAAARARASERTHLVYWVGTDNARAVAFASGYGFRPTDSRRQARTQGSEAAMVFPLAR